MFNPIAVTQLARKAEGGARLSEVDDMALVGILSTQLVYHQFVKELRVSSLGEQDRVKVVDRTECLAQPMADRLFAVAVSME